MVKKSFTAGIYTLGCKVNQYESEAISEELCKRGIKILPHSELCDIYVINTCTVTAESDRKARQFIRRAIQKNPSAYIIVTGCFSQVSPEKVAQIRGVDYICGNTDKLSVADAAELLINRASKPSSPIIAVGNINSAPFEPMKIREFERTRAYVKIEDGCESRCTYCVIPSARGNIRSKPLSDVIDEVRDLTLGGCREIVLTGIETASYGRDLDGVDLATLLCEVDKIKGIERVRLGSLDPSLITPKFVERIAPLRSLAPHFHLSLQSGSSRVLALMKRKYNADMAMRAIELLKNSIPNVKFTTDVIVGFPGESDEDFAETVAFAQKAEFLMMHIFPYSKRAGTLAAEMKEQIPANVKRQRAALLACKAKEIRSKILFSEVENNPERQVLFESYKNGIAFGHTSDFIEVAVPYEHPIHSEFKNVIITHTDGNICFGKLNEVNIYDYT